jgi:hypothetical protein
MAVGYTPPKGLAANHTGTHLFPGDRVAAAAVVDRMGVLIHEAIAGIGQRNGYRPLVQVEHRHRIERVAVGTHDRRVG